MKFQKKFVSLIAAGLLVFGVAACEGDDATTTDDTTVEDPAAEDPLADDPAMEDPAAEDPAMEEEPADG